VELKSRELTNDGILVATEFGSKRGNLVIKKQNYGVEMWTISKWGRLWRIDKIKSWAAKEALMLK